MKTSNIWFLLVLCACSGDKTTDTTNTETDADTDADSDSDTDTDTDTDTDSDADTDTTECQDILVVAALTSTGYTTSTGYGYTSTGYDTGDIDIDPDDSGFQPVDGPSTLLFDAEFGINTTGCLDEVMVEGNIVDPAIHFYFGSSEWQPSGFDFTRTDLYCTVSLLLAGGNENPMIPPSMWYGIEHDNVSTLSTCAPDSFFGSDPVDVVLSYGTHGLAVGGSLSPEAADVLQSFGLDPASFFGAILQIPWLPIYPDNQYGAAFEVDAAQNATIDDGLLVLNDPTTLVEPGGTLREGYYRITPLIYFNFN